MTLEPMILFSFSPMVYSIDNMPPTRIKNLLIKMVFFYSWLYPHNEKMEKHCLISINTFSNCVLGINISAPRLENKYVFTLFFTINMENMNFNSEIRLFMYHKSTLCYCDVHELKQSIFWGILIKYKKKTQNILKRVMNSVLQRKKGHWSCTPNIFKGIQEILLSFEICPIFQEMHEKLNQGILQE